MTIRSLFVTFSLATAALLALFFTSFFLYQRAGDEMAQAYERRYQQYQLANGFRRVPPN